MFRPFRNNKSDDEENGRTGSGGGGSSPSMFRPLKVSRSQVNISESQSTAYGSTSIFSSRGSDLEDEIAAAIGTGGGAAASSDGTNSSILSDTYSYYDGGKKPNIIRFQVVIWHIGPVDAVLSKVDMRFRVTIFWNARCEPTEHDKEEVGYGMYNPHHKKVKTKQNIYSCSTRREAIRSFTVLFFLLFLLLSFLLSGLDDVWKTTCL